MNLYPVALSIHVVTPSRLGQVAGIAILASRRKPKHPSRRRPGPRWGGSRGERPGASR